MRRTKATKAVTAVVALSLLLAACTSATKKANTSPSGSTAHESGSTVKASHKQGGTITMANEQGQTWTCQFNPFNPAVNQE